MNTSASVIVILFFEIYQIPELVIKGQNTFIY